MEEQCVTSGELTESPGGTGGKQAYKRKRNGERSSVSSRTAAKYLKRGESCVTAQAATRVGQAAGEGGWEETASQMSKGEKVEQFDSEIPVHFCPRRLADWLTRRVQGRYIR